MPAASAASARRHTAADTAVAPARPPVKTQLMSFSLPPHPKQMSSTTRSLLDPHSGAAPTELLVLGRANWRAATQGTCAQATSEGTSKGTRAYSRGLDPYRHAASVGYTERGLQAGKCTRHHQPSDQEGGVAHKSAHAASQVAPRARQAVREAGGDNSPAVLLAAAHTWAAGAADSSLAAPAALEPERWSATLSWPRATTCLTSLPFSRSSRHSRLARSTSSIRERHPEISLHLHLSPSIAFPATLSWPHQHSAIGTLPDQGAQDLQT